MGNSSTKLHPPILHLSADLIPIFLHPGDVIRLVHVGNTLLTFQIRHHAQNLKMSCNALRFMDFDEVFTTIRRFDHVHHFSFSSAYPAQRFWTPIHMLEWPSLLISLKMSFLGCIDTFMNSGNLHLQLPQLETLQLSDEANFDPQEHNYVNFKGLPIGLKVLRLSVHRWIDMAISQLALLPSELKELDLDIWINSRLEESLGNSDATHNPNHQVTLPHLPPSLTFLRLGPITSCIWRLEWSDLPHSLRHLQLDPNPNPTLPSQTALASGPQHTIENSSVSRRYTPHLETMWCPDFVWSLCDLPYCIPPSVTSFEAILAHRPHDPTEIDFDEAVRFIAPKLVSHVAGLYPKMDEVVFGGKVAFPRLVRIVGKLNGLPLNAIIPPFVTEMDWTSGIDFTAVSLIRLLSLECSSIELPFLFLPLTSLKADHLPLICVSLLPETLQQLSFHLFYDEVVTKLFRRMRHGHLPNLTDVDISRGIFLHQLPKLPPQLRKLHLDVRHAGDRPTGRSALKCLQKSNLTVLQFRFDDYYQVSFHSPEAALLTILNHLPQTLLTLIVESRLAPSRYWTLQLPRGLRFLDMTYPRGHQCDSIVLDPSSPPTFVLPPNLLSLRVPCPLPWTVEELPLHLVHIDAPGLETEYFRCRPPPRSDLTLYGRNRQ